MPKIPTTRRPSDKDTKKLFAKLEEQGVEIKTTKNGWLLKLPNGDTAMVHSTQSGYKSMMPTIARIKRAGIVL
jgi:hypothetical protein